MAGETRDLMEGFLSCGNETEEKLIGSVVGMMHLVVLPVQPCVRAAPPETCRSLQALGQRRDAGVARLVFIERRAKAVIGSAKQDPMAVELRPVPREMQLKIAQQRIMVPNPVVQ